MPLEKQGALLGIPLNRQTPPELWKTIVEVLEAPYSRCFFVVTPNPEILSYAYKNSAYAEYLRQADFALPDGIGVVMVGLLSGQSFKRFTGADLTGDLLKVAQVKSLKIGILDKNGGLSTQADLHNKLSALYPAVKFTVWKVDQKTEDFQTVLQNINDLAPDLLLVSIGFPYQEKFIGKYKAQLNCKLALAIGGSLDFIIGNRRRPPKWIRKFGMEWLYRFAEDPMYRFKRVLKALFVFPFLNIKYGLAKLFRLR
ncbi:MAG TPA: WecB/TagA/CpsF family glycosyltransferase [bacterium]|nr:WecB/TagA/CpsF family glycosyltransferase [bacterium]